MERNCSDCLAPRLAQSLCTLCNKWLCYQCTNMHQHQRPFTGSQYADSHQQLQPPAAHCPDVHQRGPGPLPSAEPGLASYPCSLLMCHTHRQEPLELFCESCDLLCCSSCHLSGHKNHRLVHVGKALQEQQWLFESLVAQVDDRRATVENTAKQVEDRLHEVKIMQRKAENQIKMAKMIMMNELNKRASLLIEQLEKISEDFQRRLEDRLQGAIEICGQLDHVHKFITWATTQHGRSPVLFSKELISLQMQQLLEPSLYMDTWVPLKIKFNWDASYWTKQIASLGELDVEGGNCPFPEGLTCPGVLRPQPVPCLSLPSGCQRGREGQGCGYQACCQPQMCCLHMVASQPDLPSVHKKQPGPVSYSSSYVPPPLASFSLHQSQQLQQCWGAETPPGTQPSLQCPPASSPALGADSIRFSCSLDGNSQAQQGTHHSQPKQHPFKCLPDNHIQQHVDKGRPDPGKPFGCSTQQQQKQQLQRAAVDEEEPAVGSREGRRKEEQGHRHTGAVEGTGERCLEHTGVRGERRSRVLPPAERREERWGSRQPPLPPGDHGDGRRSTSLDDSLTAHQRVLRSGSACGRSNSRSQSIPAELAAPSSSPSTGGPAERTHSPEGGAPDKYCSTTPRRRRASDGVIQCVAREKHPVSLDHTRCRGQTTLQLSPLLSYKTEPDNSYGFSKDEVEYEVEDKCHKARKSKSNRDNLKNSDGPKVPMVCLERLKILVSRLPPHGRRQSDPLPASQVQSSGALPQKTTWGHGRKEGNSGCSEIRRTTLSFTTPPYKELEGPSQLTTPPVASGLYNQRGNSDPKYVTQLFSASDLDPDSEPGSASEPELVSEPEPEFDPRLGSESDLSQESDPCLESWSEAEGASRAQGESLCAGETDPCGDSDAAGVSEPSVEYQPGAEPRAEGGPGDVEDLEADVVSINGDAKSDRQPDSDPGFRADSDSDLLSDQPRDSQFSSESEPELESEADVNSDEPQPLRSDLEEDSPVGPAQRPLLIANPGLQRGRVGAGGTSPEQDENEEEMESEDYCTVCLIGGDLLCCDRCPKVYHLSCHIPPLLGFPTGDWMCTLCRDVMRPEVEYDCENESVSGPSASVLGLSSCDQRKCERLTLLIFSNVLSAPFHEPVSPLARHYYQIIKRPMDLSQIRAKLNKNDTRHYSSPEDFVADVYLMFRNCAKFNYPDSEVAQAGHSLEAFFNCKLKEVFPHGAFLTTEEDSDSDEYDEAYRASENGFPWPERREQCHRKRKRRHSLNSRKHHP